MDDKLKIALVLKGCPMEIRDLLQMDSGAQASYPALRAMIVDY